MSEFMWYVKDGLMALLYPIWMISYGIACGFFGFDGTFGEFYWNIWE